MEKMEKNEKNFFRLEWLPAYCPELNPVEYLNNDFKGYLKRQGSLNKKEVIEKSKEYVSRYIDCDKYIAESRIITFFL